MRGSDRKFKDHKNMTWKLASEEYYNNSNTEKELMSLFTRYIAYYRIIYKERVSSSFKKKTKTR